MENEIGITGLGDDGVEEGQVSDSPGEGRESGAPDENSEPDYAGFSSVEELVSAHKTIAQEKADLESLKGRLGNELGMARSDKIRLEGMVEALKTAVQPQTSTISLKELEQKLEDDEITVVQFVDERDKIIRQDLENKFNQDMATKIGEIKSQWDFEKYKERFLSENPGYEEAYVSGKLAKWIDAGLSGEAAWDKFKIEQLKMEKANLESKIKTTSSQAHNAGIQTGIKIESGKRNAGKVLGPEGGSFAAAKVPAQYNSQGERHAAARALIDRMRSS